MLRAGSSSGSSSSSRKPDFSLSVIGSPGRAALSGTARPGTCPSLAVICSPGRASPCETARPRPEAPRRVPEEGFAPHRGLAVVAGGARSVAPEASGRGCGSGGQWLHSRGPACVMAGV